MEVLYIGIAFAVGVVAGWAAGVFNVAHLHNKYDALAETIEVDVAKALKAVADRVSALEAKIAAPGK